MHQTSKFKLLLLSLIAVLPSFLKRLCYRTLFGYRIGKRVRIGFTIIDAGACEIGDDTQLGPSSLITTTDHNYGDGLKTNFKRVQIGKSVWIGANVTILPGTAIGDFSVIGAGSVVTKNIPAHVVAVGVPAKVIKHLSAGPEDKTADLLNSKLAVRNE